MSEIIVDSLLRNAFAPDPSDALTYQKQNRQRAAFADSELRMWTQVFESGVVDILKPIRRSHHLKAYEWLTQKLEPGEEYVGSFNFVCETLGIDPSAVRSGILRRLAALGGSEAVMPKRDPSKKGHKGRTARKVIVCRQPLAVTAGECSSASMGAQSAEASFSSAESASAAELITPTAVNQ